MKITEVRIRKTKDPDGKRKAFASITFDDCFVVHNLKIMENERGLYVLMPSRRTESGEFKDVCHPITPEAREMIQKSVIDAFQNQMGAEPAAEAHT